MVIWMGPSVGKLKSCFNNYPIWMNCKTILSRKKCVSEHMIREGRSAAAVVVWRRKRGPGLLAAAACVPSLHSALPMASLHCTALCHWPGIRLYTGGARVGLAPRLLPASNTTGDQRVGPTYLRGRGAPAHLQYYHRLPLNCWSQQHWERVRRLGRRRREGGEGGGGTRLKEGALHSLATPPGSSCSC